MLWALDIFGPREAYEVTVEVFYLVSKIIYL